MAITSTGRYSSTALKPAVVSSYFSLLRESNFCSEHEANKRDHALRLQAIANQNALDRISTKFALDLTWPRAAEFIRPGVDESPSGPDSP